MRINELQKPSDVETFQKTDPRNKKGYIPDPPIYPSKDNIWNTLVELMEKHGFKKIGIGVNATVFQNPDYPYVVKIFKEDTGYLKWLKFIENFRGNPHVPVIRGKPTKINKYFYAIRLEPLSSAGKYPKLYAIFNKAFNQYMFNNIVPQDKNLVELFEFLKENDPILDIHSGNIMIRDGDTPTIVIIDPFYDYRA